MHKSKSLFLILFLSIFWAGCGNFLLFQSPKDKELRKTMRKEKISALYYPKFRDTTLYIPRIKPGHQLEIIINNIPEGEPFVPKSNITVDLDSSFFLPHLGKFKAVGMTSSELRDTISKRLARYFYEPEVSVGFTNLTVYIFGEFPKALQSSLLLIRERTPLVDVLGMAGISPTGSFKQLHILRKIDGKKQLIYYDITKIDATDENLVVHDGDVLYLMPRVPTLIRNATQPWVSLFSFVGVITSIVLLINRIK